LQPCAPHGHSWSNLAEAQQVNQALLGRPCTGSVCQTVTTHAAFPAKQMTRRGGSSLEFVDAGFCFWLESTQAVLERWTRMPEAPGRRSQRRPPAVGAAGPSATAAAAAAATAAVTGAPPLPADGLAQQNAQEGPARPSKMRALPMPKHHSTLGSLPPPRWTLIGLAGGGGRGKCHQMATQSVPGRAVLLQVPVQGND
jgi:hypothetical protein